MSKTWKEVIDQLRELAKFQQCPNPDGAAVSSAVRDGILQAVADLDGLLQQQQEKARESHG